MAENTNIPAAADNTASAAAEEPVLNLTAEDAEGAAAANTAGEADVEGGGAEKDAPILDPDSSENDGEATNEFTGSPETYEDFELPEGFTLEGEDKETAQAMCRELNLSQKGAQKLIDAYTKRVIAQKQADLQELAQRRKEWRNEIRQRPTFAADRALAVKGMRAVLETPEEKELFNNSWMSDHPTIFNIFTRVGRLLSEDTPLPTSGNGSDADNVNSKRFPNV